MNVKHLQTLVACCSPMTILHKLLQNVYISEYTHSDSFNGFFF